jgi:hypothetical protein
MTILCLDDVCKEKKRKGRGYVHGEDEGEGQSEA